MGFVSGKKIVSSINKHLEEEKKRQEMEKVEQSTAKKKVHAFAKGL